MRKLFFWLHLSAGVIAGVVIFIMSVTGVLLMYEKQLISWFDLRDLPPVSNSPRLSVETLLTRARASRAGMPSAIAMNADPLVPVQLIFGREIAYQDPASGQILSTGNTSVRRFFRVVTDWHRWLATSDQNRAAGRATTGAANLAFLFIVLSGAYIWVPKVWTAASVRAVTLFRGGLSGKARDFNWHNVIGIWCFVPLVFVVASSSVISYPWASNLVYTLAGSPPPSAPAPRQEQARTERHPGARSATEVYLAGFNDLWQRAASHANQWRVLTMRLPASDRAPVAFVIDQGYAGQPQKRITLNLDRRTGDITNREVYSDFNQGRQIRTWLRFVHTGEYYGIPGQTIAGIASAGAAVLAFTGIALSLRRLAAWRSRRQRAREKVLAPQASA